MKIAHSLLNLIIVSSNAISVLLSLIAPCITIIICEITLRTESSILLNSSKQDQAPQVASPLKNLDIES
jgi:hypothetical protein